MQGEDENMYVNAIELGVRDDRGGGQSSLRNQSDPYQSPKSDESSERQRGHSNLFMKVAATTGVVLLVVTLAIMIGFHITQQHEWKKGSESQAQQYSEMVGKFENLENKTKEPAREAKLNHQQVASSLKEMARDIAGLHNISQDQTREAKENHLQLSKAMAEMTNEAALFQNTSRDRAREAKLNHQQVALSLKEMARDIAGLHNISQDLTREAKQNYQQLAKAMNQMANISRAKLNLQQLASFFSNKMARDVAVFQKISQAHNVEAKERFKNISEDLETLVEKLTVRYLREAMQTYLSCRGVDLELAKSRNVTGGVFNMAITGVGTREVYCNTEIDGGGWIVMQRRMDGSVDFYRTWDEYVAGFGQASGEYWLGLEALYQLTKNGNVELRIDMITHNGTFYYAKYSNFQIGPSSDNYRLRVSGYSGNATDCFTQHNNYPFSTNDNDNDRYSGNCAVSFSGAWWFDNCHRSHLNGEYKRQDDWYGVTWYHSTIIHLKFTEMKIRQKN